MKEIFDDIYINSLIPVVYQDGSIKAYCDKNTNHCYVDHVYENLFKDIRHTTSKILEIGIYGGGSMLLWKDYFPNAHVYGVDISYYVKEFAFDSRITQIISNAYTKNFVDILADSSFDIIIDDGPHDFESFVFFIQNYWSKVKPSGYLIIEDIYDPTIIPELLIHIPPNSIETIEVYDLRHVKNLYDDVVLVIKKKD